MRAFRASAARQAPCVAPRKVACAASKRQIVSGGVAGLAAAIVVATGAPAGAEVEAQKLGLFPELRTKSTKGIESLKTKTEISAPPGGAKDPNKRDEVNAAQEKFAVGGGETGKSGSDPSPKFSAEGTAGTGLKSKDSSEFKDVKPESRG